MSVIENKDNNPSGKVRIKKGDKSFIGKGATTVIDAKHIEFNPNINNGNDINIESVMATIIKEIKLKDICDFANEVKTAVIESKIREIKASGKSVRGVLIKEGYPKDKIAGFTKRIRVNTSKNVKDI